MDRVKELRKAVADIDMVIHRIEAVCTDIGKYGSCSEEIWNMLDHSLYPLNEAVDDIETAIEMFDKTKEEYRLNYDLKGDASRDSSSDSFSVSPVSS